MNVTQLEQTSYLRPQQTRVVSAVRDGSQPVVGRGGAEQLSLTLELGRPGITCTAVVDALKTTCLPFLCAADAIVPWL